LLGLLALAALAGLLFAVDGAGRARRAGGLLGEVGALDLAGALRGLGGRIGGGRGLSIRRALVGGSGRLLLLEVGLVVLLHAVALLRLLAHLEVSASSASGAATTFSPSAPRRRRVRAFKT